MEIKEIHEDTMFTVEFTTSKPMRFSHKGKHWPITTQCVIKKEGLVIGFGEVVKHENELDSPRYGKIKSAKKAFENAGNKLWREMREHLWKQILIK